MNMSSICIKLFGTTQWCGLDIEFWISMAVCLLIVVAMNAVFWNLKPKKSDFTD